MLEDRSVLCVIDDGHLLSNGLHRSFFTLVSGHLGTARLSMLLCRGGTFVVVLPSKRARVGFGNADAFVSEHLHVVFGFAPFGPPLFDRLAGLACTAAEVSSVVKHDNHVSAWQRFLLVVIAAIDLFQIHFETLVPW